MKGIKQENSTFKMANSRTRTPTAAIMTLFILKVKISWMNDVGEEMDIDKDFYWGIYATGDDNDMRWRNCLCDEGIVREGQIEPEGW